MHRLIYHLIFSILLVFSILPQSVLRINQLGYQRDAIKVAVLMWESETLPTNFTVEDIFTGKTVFESNELKSFGTLGNFKNTARLNFSDLKTDGTYKIIAGNATSPNFRISDTVYNSTADFILQYMRQQRCGYNPFLKDSCHTHDGFPVYSEDEDSVLHSSQFTVHTSSSLQPSDTGLHSSQFTVHTSSSHQPSDTGLHSSQFTVHTSSIPVTGGWHDASDYLRYATTSATVVYHLLFAYKRNPEAFGDHFDANGDPGANGIPDVFDEAKWGLDWLNRMYPGGEEMYQQIADDRDHMMFRLPTEDSVKYREGPGRPVYRVTGKPQGLFKHQSRSTGVSSIAGKFASTMSLGSEILQKYYPDFAATLQKKALEAYHYGLKYPGYSQTAPCRAPYFYEEENWVDDMELAAAQLYSVTGDEKFLKDATSFGSKEPVTPWIGADTASHYQWYPFINLGHALIASSGSESSPEFLNYYRDGLEKLYQRGVSQPFFMGIPFIWCSNNLVSAAMTQARLYNELSNDPKYLEMEASLRDWLFGCNPWGTSMIVGLPKWGDYPVDPHSAFTHIYGYPIDGGLVDGPLYATIYSKLIGIHLGEPDEYERFQPGRIVYHDDWGDYSTNEPTHDGTAGLAVYLSSLFKTAENEVPKTAEDAKEDSVKSPKSAKSCSAAAESASSPKGTGAVYPNPWKSASSASSPKGTGAVNSTFSHGALIRLDSTKKEIALVFTAHEFADGYETITKTLDKFNAKGNFFFTGDFYRNPAFAGIIADLKAKGHYLGAHSDRHILYNSWEKRDSTLVTRQQFENDVIDNYKEMLRFGITKDDAPLYLPPFEWYNQEIASWTEGLGLKLINFTPGTRSNQDWTIPYGSYYFSSDSIYNSITRFEESTSSGLSGFLLLTHFGTHPERTDKFYLKLEELLLYLKEKGYNFVRL